MHPFCLDSRCSCMSSRQVRELPKRRRTWRASHEGDTTLEEDGQDAVESVPAGVRRVSLRRLHLGGKTAIMLDYLVYGYSLRKHSAKPTKVICCNDDTRKLPTRRLLEAFWRSIPVSHARVPESLKGSELARFEGVYSKMQTWRLFAVPGTSTRGFS